MIAVFIMGIAIGLLIAWAADRLMDWLVERAVLRRIDDGRSRKSNIYQSATAWLDRIGRELEDGKWDAVEKEGDNG